MLLRSALLAISLLVQPCLSSLEPSSLPSNTEQLSHQPIDLNPALFSSSPHFSPLNLTTHPINPPPPTPIQPRPARRALPSNCFYVCPPSTLPGGLLGLSLTLLPGNTFPTCNYILGLLGTCSYNPTTGALVGTGESLTGRCVAQAPYNCQAGSRSLTRQRQMKKRREEEEKERRRPSRRLVEGRLPEGMEGRYELWRKGRVGRLGEETEEEVRQRDRWRAD